MKNDELKLRLVRFQNFLQQDPDNLKLIHEVANLHMELGELTQARTVLENALTKWPSQPGLLSQLANIAMANGDHGLAVHLLQGLVEAGQHDAILYYNLAYAYLYQSKAQEAKQLLLKVIDKPEALPQISLLMAQVCHRLGEMEEAIQYAQTYLQLQPDDAEVWGVMALLNLDLQNSEDARTAANKALLAQPGNMNALITLGSLALDVQNGDEAVTHFEKVLEHNPKSGRAWSGMGLVNMLRKDPEKAERDLKLAVEYMPDHIGTWHALAWCQLTKNDLTAAEKSFNCSMEINRNFAETHGGLAVVHAMQGQTEIAENEMKRALRLDPNSFAGRFAQSLLLNKTDPAKAQELLNNILSSSPIPGGESLRDMLSRINP